MHCCRVAMQKLGNEGGGGEGRCGGGGVQISSCRCLINIRAKLGSVLIGNVIIVATNK